MTQSCAIIGFGNPLCGDDGAACCVLDRLRARHLPGYIRLTDAGTQALDGFMAMEGASNIILIDACATGSEPGAVFALPFEEWLKLPATPRLDPHRSRWHEALGWARWRLGTRFPASIRIYLIEGCRFEPGDPMTDAVREGAHRLADYLAAHIRGTAWSGAAPERIRLASTPSK